MRSTRVDLPRRAEEGRAVAAREGERRGEGREAEKDEDGRARTRTRGDERRRQATTCRSRPCPIDFDGIDDRSSGIDGRRQAICSASAGGPAGQIYSTCRRRDRPASSLTCEPADGKSVAAALRPARRARARRRWPRAADYVRRRADGKKLPATAPGPTWSHRRRTATKADARRRAKLQPRRRRGPRRSAGRVEADLRRGLADQPRLLLRPEHARRRLAGDEDEVRGRSCRTSRRAAT